MDINEQYAYEIKHEIAFLKNRMADYAILSQLSIISKIPDDNERAHE